MWWPSRVMRRTGSSDPPEESEYDVSVCLRLGAWRAGSFKGGFWRRVSGFLSHTVASTTPAADGICLVLAMWRGSSLNSHTQRFAFSISRIQRPAHGKLAKRYHNSKRLGLHSPAMGCGHGRAIDLIPIKCHDNSSDSHSHFFLF